MIGNYALTLTATGRLHVLEHILFLLTDTMCTIRTFSIVILSCPFQRPVQLCELFCLSGPVMLTLKLHQPQQDPIGLLGNQGTLLARGQPVVHQDTQVPLHRAALQQVRPKPVLMHAREQACERKKQTGAERFLSCLWQVKYPLLFGKL